MGWEGLRVFVQTSVTQGVVFHYADETGREKLLHKTKRKEKSKLVKEEGQEVSFCVCCTLWLPCCPPVTVPHLCWGIWGLLEKLTFIGNPLPLTKGERKT